MMAQRNKLKALTLLGTSILAGCAGGGLSGIDGRTDSAQTIASAAELSRGDITAGGYRLAVWRHMSDPAAPVNLYIEGDGLAWLSRSTPSMNPTPTEPVALRLASSDPAPNVVYLARPCQFTPLEQSPSCSQRSWTQGRFDADVLAAMNAALDEVGTHSGFNLIGFSGGGNIAALLAARRSDVLSLRTVAGNVDPEALNALHKVSAMPTALNARDVALRISTLPQMHFIGGQDEIVSPEVFASYARAAANAPCVGSQIVPTASHTDGWQALWPTLLAKPFPCSK
jgi:hypothetical protein